MKNIIVPRSIISLVFSQFESPNKNTMSTDVKHLNVMSFTRSHPDADINNTQFFLLNM